MTFIIHFTLEKSIKNRKKRIFNALKIVEFILFSYGHYRVLSSQTKSQKEKNA